MREAEKGSNARVIARELHVKRTEMDGLLKRLDAMERDGQLLCDAKGNYKVDKSTHFITGYVHSHPDGYGFVIPEEGGRRYFPVGKRDAQGHAQRQGAGSCGQCRQAGTSRRAYRLGIDSRPYAYRRPPDQ